MGAEGNEVRDVEMGPEGSPLY